MDAVERSKAAVRVFTILSIIIVVVTFVFSKNFGLETSLMIMGGGLYFAGFELMIRVSQIWRGVSQEKRKETPAIERKETTFYLYSLVSGILGTIFFVLTFLV